jgi:hypothetical protein
VNGVSVSSGLVDFGLTGTVSSTFSGLTYTATFGAGGSFSVTGTVSGVSGTTLETAGISGGTFQVICDTASCSGGTGTISVNLSAISVNPGLLSLLGSSAPNSGSISENLLKMKLNGVFGTDPTDCFMPGVTCSFHSTSMNNTAAALVTTPVPPALILFGTGLIVIAGALRRRRQTPHSLVSVRTR